LKIIIIKIKTKWHILNEEQERQEETKGERTTMRHCLPWQFAQIVALGIFITLCVENVVITEVN